jgi:DNA ligase-1
LNVLADDRFKKAGYEGAIIRQLGIGYEHKRSSQLLKMKDFLDSEFLVVGVEEGRGKLQGHCGAFACSTQEGKIFSVKMAGDTRFLKTIFEICS